MWQGSDPIPRFGHRAQPLCRRRLDRGAADHRSGFNAMDSTSQSRSRHSPSACRKRRGKRSPGAREPRIGSPRALPAEEWLLIEWPEDETEPTKYWFSTLPEDIAFDRLVDLTKLRWRIERDYQELKQELGLGDYEGRGWRGFHHHATLCIAAYGFLIAERGAIPPSGPGFSTPLSGSAIPEGYQPRGAADPTRTAHPKLDRDDATPPHRRSRQDPPEMPLLQRADPQDGKNPRLLTQ